MVDFSPARAGSINKKKILSFGCIKEELGIIQINAFYLLTSAIFNCLLTNET